MEKAKRWPEVRLKQTILWLLPLKQPLVVMLPPRRQLVALVQQLLVKLQSQPQKLRPKLPNNRLHRTLPLNRLLFLRPHPSLPLWRRPLLKILAPNKRTLSLCPKPKLRPAKSQSLNLRLLLETHPSLKRIDTATTDVTTLSILAPCQISLRTKIRETITVVNKTNVPIRNKLLSRTKIVTAMTTKK